MIICTMQHEYAPIAIALSAYLHYKVKSTHDYERVTLLTMRVHHTKYIIIHKQAYIYIYTYIHTYIHTSCTMLACRHCHTLGMRPKQDTRKGNPSTWFQRRLKERERERKRRPLGEASPPNLLNITLFGLASLPFLLTPRKSCPRSKHPCSKHVHAMEKETQNQQTSKETTRKKAWEKTN